MTISEPTNRKPPGGGPPPPMISRAPLTAWILLALFLPLALWLVVEIERTVGLSSPHFWNLLRDDRMFALAMLDFFCTAGWAFLVMGDRAHWKGWRLWVTLPVFCIVPTLGIILFLFLNRNHRRGGLSDSTEVGSDRL